MQKILFILKMSLEKLAQYNSQGRLHATKMILLTSCHIILNRCRPTWFIVQMHESLQYIGKYMQKHICMVVENRFVAQSSFKTMFTIGSVRESRLFVYTQRKKAGKCWKKNQYYKEDLVTGHNVYLFIKVSMAACHPVRSRFYWQVLKFLLITETINPYKVVSSLISLY